MSELPQRTLEELLARYENEPHLADLYVEGPFDRDVLGHALFKANLLNVTVYEIASVEVPDSLLYSIGLTTGNKQRVIALAKRLSELTMSCRYRCIVDRDLEPWIGELMEIPRLNYTAFSDIETYFLSELHIRELVVIGASASIDHFSPFCDSIIQVLRDLFSLRLADRRLGWNMRWISFDRCLSRVNSRVELDLADYVTRVLAANGKAARRSDFEGEASEWRRQLAADPRHECRGHDFVDLLAWSIRRFNGLRDLATSEAVQRLLILLAPQRTDLLILAD